MFEDYFISIKWYSSDVWHRCKLLTASECVNVLERAYAKHDASVGMNWDVIDFWIESLYPRKYNKWCEMDEDEQDEFEEKGMIET